MPTATFVKRNLYKDSVALMRIAESVRAQDRVGRVTLLMGTQANKAILEAGGLFSAALDAAGPGDVMVAVEAETDSVLDSAVGDVAQLLEQGPRQGPDETPSQVPLRSIASARSRGGEAATLVQISVPGPYAGAEAVKALRQGLHVFLFSDNVPLEQERFIKKLARDKGLLVMGPDCGTAIIHGVPLGFANRVRAGEIGLIGASGTGLQEVTCQIHALGSGVRHAIGTGGRDVYAEVGGSTMSQAIDLLAADAHTRVIGIVSKPPAPAVKTKLLAQLARVDKPSVVLFLGADHASDDVPPHVIRVGTLYDVALATTSIATGRPFVRSSLPDDWVRVADAEARRLARGQVNVRGLYSGGTFCTEAQVLWRELGLRVASNAPLDQEAVIKQSGTTPGHLAIDLGADEFTVGRPHPMIDVAARLESIAREANDPATAVIVLDVVLGYASHPDPAGALAPAIKEAKTRCAAEGRHLAVVASVCGTEGDPQQLSPQQAWLRDAGALVLPNHTMAARLAGQIASRAASRFGTAALAR